MVFRDMWHSGGDDSGHPDILLCKKEKDGTCLPVLPVVVELPDSEPSGRLALSMRQLKLGCKDEPVCAFVADFQKDDMNGSAICDLLLYENFSPEKMNGFVMDAIHG